MAASRVWIVKANEKPRQTRKRGWHWREFFESPERWPWGGREWVNSPVSMKHLRDSFRKGDTVVAWQAGEGIVGFLKAASDGYEEQEGSGRYNTFYVAASPCRGWTATPISIDEVKESPILRQMEALRMPRGTVFSVTPRQWAEIRRLTKRHSLATDAQLRRFAP